MAKEHTISLRDLRQHVLALNRLVEDAFTSADEVATLNFEEVKEHARGIMAIVEPKATKDADPHAATATSAPKAADTEKQRDAQKRDAYRQAAADKAPVDLSAVLGLGHIRRS